MMRVLVPTYTLRIEIGDPIPTPVQGVAMGVAHHQYQAQVDPGTGQKYWNGLTGKSGCDEVVKAVQEALSKANVSHATVTFERFEHK